MEEIARERIERAAVANALAMVEVKFEMIRQTGEKKKGTQ